MKRSIKTLLTVSAMLALTAITASSAFATKGEWDFGSTMERADLTGSQIEENILTVNGGTVKCKEASFTGTVTGTPAATIPGGSREHWYSHTVTVHPKYGNCTTFGQAGSVTTEEEGGKHCDYVLTPTATETGTVIIECTEGFQITIHATTAGCTIKIPAQTPFNNKVDFKEEGAGTLRDLKITSTVGPESVIAGQTTGIKYTSTGGICGASGENGKYRGTVTEKAYIDNQEHVEKNQRPLFTAETVE